MFIKKEPIMSYISIFIISIILIISSNSFSSISLTDEERDLRKTRTSMAKTFNDFFAGRLDSDAVEGLDGKTFLSFIIENMYDPITHSVKNAEYIAILKALKEKRIITPQTERITVKYSEDYSVIFDKFVGYNFIDELKGPKKLHNYFAQYYQSKKDNDEEMSDKSDH